MNEPGASPIDGPQVRAIFEACIDIAPSEREVLAAALAGDDIAIVERALQLCETHDLLESEVSFDAPPPEQLARAAVYLESISGERSEAVTPALVQALRELTGALGLAGVESRYRLGETVATGGMGEIRDAFDTTLGRHVAAKILRDVAVAEPFEELSAKQAWRVRRFLTEIEITADLQHPSIPPVYSRGLTAAGALLFTMPRLRGKNLTETIKEADTTDIAGRNRLLRILCSVGDALAFAHSRGVIHRDLKPGNVMVGEAGEIYLIDWGLARRVQNNGSAGSGRAPRAGPETSDQDTGEGEASATRTARALGTLAYMPPEQSGALSAASGTYSDIYSLGASVAHVLLGQVPILPHGELGHALVGSGHSAELVAIVKKATAFQPADRYSSIQAMVTDLRAAMDHRVVQAHATGPLATARKWTRRNRIAAAAMGAFAIAVIAATGFYIRSLQIERTRAKAHEQSSSRVASCLTAVFRDINLQKGHSSTLQAVDLIRSLQHRIDQNLGHPDDADAYLRWSALNAQQLISVGEREYADSIARRVVELGVETGRGGSNSVAIAREVLVNSLIIQNTAEATDEAEEVIRASLNAWDTSSEATPVWRFNSLGQLSELRRIRGDRIGYRTAAEDLIKLMQQLSPGSESEAVERANLILDRLRADEHAEALGEARELLEFVLAAEWGGKDHTKAIAARGSILSCLRELGQTDEAVRTGRALVKDAIRLHGDDGFQTSLFRRHLAFALVAQGPTNIDEAQGLMGQAADAFAASAIPNYRALVNTLLLQSMLWGNVGRAEEAHETNQRALSIAQEHYDFLDPLRVGSLVALCGSHSARGEFAEADLLMRDAFAQFPSDRQLVPIWPDVLHAAATAADGVSEVARAEELWRELLASAAADPQLLAAAKKRLGTE